MRALDSLERDHRLLQGLTDALEAYVAALEAGVPLHPGDLSDLVHAFRTVADYRHFEKVEEVLIPWLARNGFDWDLDRLDDGRQARERVRYLIAVLHQSAERELNWNLDECGRIARGARHLVEEQRRIMAREAVELFPEILTRLEPATLRQLTEQLCQFDAANAGRWPERDLDIDMAALAEAVLARYAPSLQLGTSLERAPLGREPLTREPSTRELQASLQSALQVSRDLPSPREMVR